MLDTHEDIDRLLREGIAAVKNRDKQTAREKLMRVIELDQYNEQGWLWLSSVVEDREEAIICLENVLTINPHNERARRGMEKLGVPIPERLQPDPEPEPDPFEALTSHSAPDALEDEEQAWRRQLMDRASSDEGKSKRAQRTRKRVDKQMAAVELAQDVPVGEERTLLDLADAWFAALTFKERDLYAEIQSATWARIGMNVLFAMFLAAALGGISALIIANQNITLADLGNTSAADIADLEAAFGLAPGTILESLPTIAAISAGVAPVIGVFITAVVYSFAVHIGAKVLGGTGDFMHTAHAVTIAMVARQIVGLVPSLLATLFGVGIGLVGVLLGIYNIAVAAVALSSAHEELGLFKAVLAPIAGGIMLTIFACGAIFCLSFTLPLLAG